MKDNADPRRIHSALCVTVQMTPAAQASSAAKPQTVGIISRRCTQAAQRTPISVAPLRNAVSLWLAPSGIKSASSKLCPAASLAVAAPTWVNGSQGSHGALNAKRTLRLWSSSPGRARAHLRSRSAEGPSTSRRIASSDATTALMVSVSRRLQFPVSW